MKRLGLFMVAFAAVTMLFSSCKKEQDGPNLDDVIEDGFYVGGPATGSESLAVEYRLASGVNEAKENVKRAGMYEKYVALEANKDFYLLLREAKNETRYSATLEDFNTEGANDQPTVTLKRGKLETGASAPAMKVAESGLYHIVLDLNETGDLANPQIIVAPVQWGTRGVNGNWGWTAMEGGEFNRTEMVWTATFPEVSTGDFKFSYGGGWKIQLDDAGNVKANTNLGLDMLPGGSNIPLQKGTDVKITLTWKLNGGEISTNYSMKLDGKFVTEDPTQFVVGFSGNAFGAEIGEWGDPNGAAKAVYNAEESKVTNETTKAGTYVYDITGLTFNEGKEFKARVNGAWLAFKDVTIEGASFTAASPEKDDSNILVGETATYDVKFVVEWNGAKAAKVTLKFTKK